MARYTSSYDNPTDLSRIEYYNPQGIEQVLVARITDYTRNVLGGNGGYYYITRTPNGLGFSVPISEEDIISINGKPYNN